MQRSVDPLAASRVSIGAAKPPTRRPAGSGGSTRLLVSSPSIPTVQQGTMMSDFLSALRTEDPAVYDAVLREAQRQNDHLELIASENFVSRAVLDAVGTVL